MSQECAGCGVVNDATTGIGNDHAVPPAGAVSICWTCSHVAVFTGDGLDRRPASAGELLSMLKDVDFVRATLAVHEGRRRSKAGMN